MPFILNRFVLLFVKFYVSNLSINGRRHIQILHVLLGCKEVRPNVNASLKSICLGTEVQVGKDQEKAQSEKDSHSKNRGGKKN